MCVIRIRIRIIVGMIISFILCIRIWLSSYPRCSCVVFLHVIRSGCVMCRIRMIRFFLCYYACLSSCYLYDSVYPYEYSSYYSSYDYHYVYVWLLFLLV